MIVVVVNRVVVLISYNFILREILKVEFGFVLYLFWVCFVLVFGLFRVKFGFFSRFKVDREWI